MSWLLAHVTSAIYEHMRVFRLKKWAVSPTVTPSWSEYGEGRLFDGDLSGSNNVKRFLWTRFPPKAENRS
jgi:hypothetical protein